MVQVRQLLDLTLATAVADPGRVCYMIMPRGEKENILQYIDNASREFDCTIVAIFGAVWNDDLTPWPAPGVFKQKKPFGGYASIFLERLVSEYISAIEHDLGFDNPERYLMGVSLSGLFVLWALTATDKFDTVASISGSLWYDGFAQWFAQQEVCTRTRAFVSLGESEHLCKEKRMSSVRECTEAVVQALQAKGVETHFQMVPGTHFSDIRPRLDLALRFATR